MKNFTKKLKQFGAKVTRVKDNNGNFYQGVYKYNGVNFDAVVNDAECETKWWEVDKMGIYGITAENALLVDEFEGYNTFTTKNEVIAALWGLDEAISENPSAWIAKLDERITRERRLMEMYAETSYRIARVDSLENTKNRIIKNQ